jgi:hypothetical protein
MFVVRERLYAHPIFHAFHINITLNRRSSRRSLGTLEENVLSEVGSMGDYSIFTLFLDY